MDVAKSSQWTGFIQQAIYQAEEAGTPHWMLISKRDRKMIMVTFPEPLWWTHTHLLKRTSGMLIHGSGFGKGLTHMPYEKWKRAFMHLVPRLAIKVKRIV